MHIKGIIRHSNYHSDCYDTSAITLTDVLASQDGTQQVIVCLETDDGAIMYIDLSLLYAEQPASANGVTDWASMETYLTNLDLTVLVRYRTVTLVPYQMQTVVDGVLTLIPTPFYTEITTQLNIYSVENNFGIEVGYGSHLSPGIRNNKRLKWNLPDLVFTRAIPGEVVNFNNTIPVVNGVVCYPYVYEDALFAYQGAKLASKVSDLNKNILLIDYSELGDLDIIPLYKCEHICTTGLDEKITVNDSIVQQEDMVKFQGTIEEYVHSSIKIEFYLPEGTEVGYPMVCIGGRMFEPSMYHIKLYNDNNRYKVEIELDRKLLEIIVAANFQKFKRQLRNTTMVRVILETTIKNLFQDPDNFTGSTEEEVAASRYMDKTVPFVAMLHSEERLIHNIIEPIRILYPDKLMFPVGTGGLLINKKTREIVDYVKIPYDSGNLVTFPVQSELRLMDRDNLYDLTTPNLAITRHNSSYTDKYNPFSTEYDDTRALKNYVLYDLTVARPPDADEETDPSEGEEEPTPVDPEEPEIKLVPILIRVSAQAINVHGIEEVRCGNYTLTDSTSSGLTREWKLHHSIYPAQEETYIAYDTAKSCWYIGTPDNHLYESSIAHAGSSPWHQTLQWHSTI